MTTSSRPDVEQMAQAIVATLRARPAFFMDLVRQYRAEPYRTLLLAWGVVRGRHRLSRDDDGRYFLAPGDRPSSPPVP